MPMPNEVLSGVLDMFDHETLMSVLREKGLVKGLVAVSAIAIKSTECGPTSPSSVKIKDVTGEGPNAETAMKNAHTNAKALGQASCDGGCPAATSCKYVEDNWDASPPVSKDNKWVTTGTTSGHCNCE